jgi:hypothetical protein
MLKYSYALLRFCPWVDVQDDYRGDRGFGTSRNGQKRGERTEYRLQSVGCWRDDEYSHRTDCKASVLLCWDREVVDLFSESFGAALIGTT